MKRTYFSHIHRNLPKKTFLRTTSPHSRCYSERYYGDILVVLCAELHEVGGLHCESAYHSYKNKLLDAFLLSFSLKLTRTEGIPTLPFYCIAVSGDFLSVSISNSHCFYIYIYIYSRPEFDSKRGFPSSRDNSATHEYLKKYKLTVGFILLTLRRIEFFSDYHCQEQWDEC